MKYIFGYGSLLYAAGINGRGMKRLYSDQELLPTILVDYQRRWNASYSGGILYLGLSISNRRIRSPTIPPQRGIRSPPANVRIEKCDKTDSAATVIENF